MSCFTCKECKKKLWLNLMLSGNFEVWTTEQIEELFLLAW